MASIYRFVTIFIILMASLLVSCAHQVVEYNEQGTEQPKELITLRYTSYLLDTAQAGKTYYEAIAKFESLHSHIKIETDFIQNVNYTSGIKMRLLGGEKMDVFDTWSPSLFKEVLAVRDDAYLDLTGSEFLDAFLPASLEPVTIDGRVYGVPEVMHSDGLLYNATMFKELNLDVPTTWEAFLEVCEVLKSHGIIPIAMDSEWWVPQFFWGSMMSNNGADAEWTSKLEQGEIGIDHPFFVDAIQKMKEMVDREYIPENWAWIKHEQSKDLIGQGKAAMMIAGTWDVPSTMARNADIDINFMMVPGDTKTVPNINIGTYRVINSQTKYPEEAKAFVAFMNGRENQERLALGASAVPSIEGFELEHPVIETIAAAVMRDDAKLYWPHTVSTESVQVKIQEEVNKYLLGQSLEETLNHIQATIDSARE